MTNIPTDDEMLALLRFRLVDMRNSTPMACEALMGQAADEIAKLRGQLDAAEQHVKILQRQVASLAPDVPGANPSGCICRYKHKSDPMCPYVDPAPLF